MLLKLGGRSVRTHTCSIVASGCTWYCLSDVFSSHISKGSPSSKINFTSVGYYSFLLLLLSRVIVHMALGLVL